MSSNRHKGKQRITILELNRSAVQIPSAELLMAIVCGLLTLWPPWGGMPLVQATDATKCALLVAAEIGCVATAGGCALGNAANCFGMVGVCGGAGVLASDDPCGLGTDGTPTNCGQDGAEGASGNPNDQRGCPEEVQIPEPPVCLQYTVTASQATAGASPQAELFVLTPGGLMFMASPVTQVQVGITTWELRFRNEGATVLGFTETGEEVFRQAVTNLSTGDVVIAQRAGGLGNAQYFVETVETTAGEQTIVFGTQNECMKKATSFLKADISMLLQPVDTTPPAITVSATPEILLQPNNTMVPVVIAGTITDNLSGVDLTSARFSVSDEFGLFQPSGPITVNANGSYSFTIQLPVFVLSVPQGFQQYTITVSATDNAGNKGSAATGVIVLYDQGK